MITVLTRYRPIVFELIYPAAIFFDLIKNRNFK